MRGSGSNKNVVHVLLFARLQQPLLVGLEHSPATSCNRCSSLDLYTSRQSIRVSESLVTCGRLLSNAIFLFPIWGYISLNNSKSSSAIAHNGWDYGVKSQAESRQSNERGGMPN